MDQPPLTQLFPQRHLDPSTDGNPQNSCRPGTVGGMVGKGGPEDGTSVDRGEQVVFRVLGAG